MQLQVKGKGMSVTDALFEHAEQKLERVARVFPPWDEATQVELELSVERNPKISAAQIAEVTVRTKGPVLRVRESSEDMYAAIDQAARKLERQALPVPARLVKSKSFEMKPMAPEDAALHMDMLHHDFYVFRNEADGRVNVVYRRRDGDYGLIAPDD